MALILVIDDHLDTLCVFRRMMERWGYPSLAAETGEAGLALLVDHRPDLIIVDEMMPGMNGVEFIRLVRSDPVTARIPVILNTAIADVSFAANAIQKGANEAWLKSKIDYNQIRERVAGYVNGNHGVD